MFLLLKIVNVMVIRMDEKLERILLGKSGNVINKTKLERILGNRKTKLERILNYRKNKEFEDTYQELKLQYISSDNFSRQLLKDNIKLANKYVVLDSDYNDLKLQVNEKNDIIALQKIEKETLSEKLKSYVGVEKDIRLLKRQVEIIIDQTKNIVDVVNNINEANEKIKKIESYTKDVKNIVDGYRDLLNEKTATSYKPKHAISNDLEEKIEDVKEFPDIDLSKYYSGNGYYTRITNIRTSNNSSLTKVVEILSGDYVKENGRRAWTWKEREKEVRKYYNDNHIEYNNNDKQKIEKIVDVVKSNKYARRKHEKKLNKIYSYLKTPNEPKVKRFFKRGWRKLSDKVKDYVQNYKTGR